MRRTGIFSMGGLLSRFWQPAYPLLPWALTSALLTVAGLWDYWSGRGPIEWVVVGLAAYELMLGLLAEHERGATVPGTSQSSTAERGTSAR